MEEIQTRYCNSIQPKRFNRVCSILSWQRFTMWWISRDQSVLWDQWISKLSGEKKWPEWVGIVEVYVSDCSINSKGSIVLIHSSSLKLHYSMLTWITNICPTLKGFLHGLAKTNSGIMTNPTHGCSAISKRSTGIPIRRPYWTVNGQIRVTGSASSSF